MTGVGEPIYTAPEKLNIIEFFFVENGYVVRLSDGTEVFVVGADSGINELK